MQLENALLPNEAILPGGSEPHASHTGENGTQRGACTLFPRVPEGGYEGRVEIGDPRMEATWDRKTVAELPSRALTRRLETGRTESSAPRCCTMALRLLICRYA